MGTPGRFFPREEFAERFESEAAIACDVEDRLRAKLPRFAQVTPDITFVSDDRAKLEALRGALAPAGYRMEPPALVEGRWECGGQAPPLPIDEDLLVFWVLDLVDRGFDHDCVFEAYGTTHDWVPTDLALGAKLYFDGAMSAYEAGNRGGAIANFSISLAIDPTNPNTWYSRAGVLDQINCAIRAREDYDKAIGLAPDFVSALVNRGANKDNAGEYDDAIADYDRALAIDPGNANAIFNRGNSKLNKGDVAGACADWRAALARGLEHARTPLARYDR